MGASEPGQKSAAAGRPWRITPTHSGSPPHHAALPTCSRFASVNLPSIVASTMALPTMPWWPGYSPVTIE
jgi:hypothetical protein